LQGSPFTSEVSRSSEGKCCAFDAWFGELGIHNPDLLREERGKTIYGVIPRDSAVREKVIQMFASHPLEEYRRGMLEFGSSVPDLVPAFRALDLPVLGLCGADDPYPDKPEVLAGMVRFREASSIPGAGRFVHWERPREFNATVREFLRTL
jgi:pimeloyl-ACP methyl ester carboxylesterase